MNTRQRLVARTAMLLVSGLVVATGCVGVDADPFDSDGARSEREPDPQAANPGPGFPGAGEDGPGSLGGEILCFYGGQFELTPAASIEFVLETSGALDVVHTRLTFNPDFVDNSFGATSIGWSDSKKGEHEFKQLVGSDHSELIFTDGNGDEAVRFKTDYISEDDSITSGYRSMGVSDNDGEVIVGNESHFVHALTSLDRNLNERGYAQYVVDSPATDDEYTPPAEAPNWDYRVVYEVWIANEAFGDAGMGTISLEQVHASPSKTGDNTIIVTPGPCPPEWGLPPGDNEPPSTSTPPDTPESVPPTCPTGDACTDSCPAQQVCVSGCCTVVPN
jgi:hypothetical protein